MKLVVTFFLFCLVQMTLLSTTLELRSVSLFVFISYF